jgi:hypothetical protein
MSSRTADWVAARANAACDFESPYHKRFWGSLRDLMAAIAGQCEANQSCNGAAGRRRLEVAQRG